MSKKDGGSAYPFHGIAGDEWLFDGGMTLRDYFAGQALAGLSAAHDSDGTWMTDPTNAAREAYKAADAMIAERDKED